MQHEQIDPTVALEVRRTLKSVSIRQFVPGPSGLVALAFALCGAVLALAPPPELRELPIPGGTLELVGWATMAVGFVRCSADSFLAAGLLFLTGCVALAMGSPGAALYCFAASMGSGATCSVAKR